MVNELREYADGLKKLEADPLVDDIAEAILGILKGDR